jgi:hypothetical protein
MADKLTLGGAVGAVSSGLWAWLSEHGPAVAALCAVISVAVAVVSALISNYIKWVEHKHKMKRVKK